MHSLAVTCSPGVSTGGAVNQYVIVGCNVAQSKCNQVGQGTPVDVGYSAASLPAAISYAETLGYQSS